MKRISLIIVYIMLLANMCICQVDFIVPDSINILYDGNYNLHIAKNLNSEKWGVLNSDGSIHTPFKYDKILPFYDELALVFDHAKCGYLNLEGKIQIPFDYVLGDHFKNGKATVSKGYRNGVINKQNEVVIDFKYNVLHTHDHTTYHFQLEPRKSGLMDTNENIVVEPEFDIFLPENDSLWIGRRNWKFEIYDNQGNRHNELDFTEFDASANSAGLIWCTVDGLYGFLDEHYNLKINPQYKKIGPSAGSLQSVSDGNQFGFIDQNNNTVVDYIYDDAKKLNNKYCIVIKKGKYNLMTSNGALYFDTDRNYISTIFNSNLILIDGFVHNTDFEKLYDGKVQVKDGFEHGMLKIYSNQKVGYLDTLGKLKIPLEYDYGEKFYEEQTTAVSKGGKWGFIDHNNKQLTAIEYDTVIHYGRWDNCNFIVKQGNLYGLFEGNKLLFKPRFDEITPIGSYDLVFRKGNSFSAINKQTKLLHELPFELIESSDLGYLVKQNGKYGFLNINFEEVIPITYDTLINLGFYFIATRNGKYGTISERNEIIEAFRFDEIITGMGIIKTRNGSKFGALSESGKLILETKYDTIKKLDWKNVEVTLGDKREIINIVNLQAK